MRDVPAEHHWRINPTEDVDGILRDAVAWLDCVTTAIHPGGDHLAGGALRARVGNR